jgi:hypothetical protein
MDARDASHLGTFPNAAAAAWRHRRSEPAAQSNLDRPNHGMIWSASSPGESTDYRTRSGTAAGPRGTPFQQFNILRSMPAQAREHNELKVCLSFEDHEKFEGIALLDTGARDNWISDSLSRQLLLPRQNFREEIFAGFEGRRVKCSESVHGFWHYGYRTFSVTFKICNDLPVDILFGLDLLRRVGLVNFDKINEENLKKVLVLAKLKANEGKLLGLTFTR